MTLPKPTTEQWANVKLVALDVDGVLTDGSVIYGPQGELGKPFFIRDGMGMRLLEAAGVHVAIITSEDSALVRQRAERLMLSAYEPGRKRKGEALKRLMKQFDAERRETVYIGDDVNDAEAFELAGIDVAPADGSDYARNRANYVTSAPGGRGAVREVADLILGAKGVDSAALWAYIHGKV